MKANEAPEKIYLQVCGDCNVNDCENCKFEDLEDNVTWCKDKIFEKDIEYTRTDAFIEKACKWLEKVTYTHPRSGKEVCMINLSRFKDYMKGEMDLEIEINYWKGFRDGLQRKNNKQLK